jgi:hypothetical protein
MIIPMEDEEVPFLKSCAEGTKDGWRLKLPYGEEISLGRGMKGYEEEKKCSRIQAKIIVDQDVG